jgi:RNA polymerase primary sigma factor
MTAIFPTTTGRETCPEVETPLVGRRQSFPGLPCHDAGRFGRRFDQEKEFILQDDEQSASAEQAQKAEVTISRDSDSEAAVHAASRPEPLEEPCETSITLYMREIGRVKLLTPREEIELAARIKQGDPEARDQMIKANLRLVVKIARGYEGLGLPLLDLISEGNIGLMRAVERFDPNKGAKLSTYSAWWIKHAITQALASQSKATRVPMHVMEKLGKIGRVSLQLQAELGREPTDEELAGELGTTASRIAQMRMAISCPVSLEAPWDGEGSGSYAEIIADEKAEMPYQQLENESVRSLVWKMIDTLTWREKAVLNLRFGLNGQDPKNLEQTGKELDITDERARQIQTGAFLKLRRRIRKLEQNPASGFGENTMRNPGWKNQMCPQAQ